MCCKEEIITLIENVFEWIAEDTILKVMEYT